MTFPNEKEKIKAEIKVLEAKLSLIEKMEKYKSPAEEAFKRFLGRYPVTDIADTCWDGKNWVHFEAGYRSAKEDYKVGEYQPTAQTPEQVAQGLRDAMETAKENGVFDEPKPETLTLKQLLKKWEFDFAVKWENPKTRGGGLYEEEVERFIQMFIEWMPDANKGFSYGEWERGWNTGFNNYRHTLMEKLK